MLLKVRDLCAGYGDTIILARLDLDLESHEVLAILGRNGIGKTTLVKTLAGLLKARSGSVLLAGSDVTHLPPPSRARLGLGYVPQGREIFSKLTVHENLLVGIKALGLSPDAVETILEDFPALRPKLRSPGGSLSGGQQQLLALARALVLQPKLLLLDEPSEGIQPSILDEIHDVLMKAKRTRDLSILLVEQNLDFAGALADRACLMEDRHISRDIDPRRLLDDPTLLHEFIGRGRPRPHSLDNADAGLDDGFNRSPGLDTE